MVQGSGVNRSFELRLLFVLVDSRRSEHESGGHVRESRMSEHEGREGLSMKVEDVRARGSRRSECGS